MASDRAVAVATDAAAAAAAQGLVHSTSIEPLPPTVTAAPTLTDDCCYYYQDKSLWIRRYEDPGDAIPVQQLFKKSNEAFMIPAVVRYFGTHPLFGALVLFTSTLTHCVMEKIIFTLSLWWHNHHSIDHAHNDDISSSSINSIDPNNYSRYENDLIEMDFVSPPSSSTTLTTDLPFSSFWLLLSWGSSFVGAEWYFSWSNLVPCTTALATVALWYVILFRFIKFVVEIFVRRGLDDDLCQIASIYDLPQQPAQQQPRVLQPKSVSTPNGTSHRMNGYQTNSNNSSVSDEHRPRGNFIVAVDPQTGQIIGCVGAQEVTKCFLEQQLVQQQLKDKDKGICGSDGSNRYHQDGNFGFVVYKLRRMAVDPDQQRRSIARKLIDALERSLVLIQSQHQPNQQPKEQQQQPQPSHWQRMGVNTTTTLIYLSCRSVQTPAMTLYKRCGYTLVRSYAPKEAPWWVRYSGIRICRFEKTIVSRLQDNDHQGNDNER